MQRHLKPGPLQPELLDELRERSQKMRACQANLHPALQAAGHPCDVASRFLQPGQHRLGVGQKSLACFTEHHTAAGPVKKARAQLGLQVGDLKTQRWL